MSQYSYLTQAPTDASRQSRRNRHRNYDILGDPEDTLDLNSSQMPAQDRLQQSTQQDSTVVIQDTVYYTIHFFTVF